MKKKRSTSALALLAIAVLAGCAEPAGRRDHEHAEVTLGTKDGLVVNIPMEGPRYDSRAALLATDLQKLDRSMGAWKTSLRKVDPELSRELQDLAAAERDQAVRDVDLAYRIADRTSGGQLDADLLASARASVEDVKRVLKPNPESYKWTVKTNITTTIDRAHIHYVSAGEHEQHGDKSFKSYTLGQQMRIGRYVFRVQPLDAATKPFMERLTIMVDPTVVSMAPHL